MPNSKLIFGKLFSRTIIAVSMLLGVASLLGYYDTFTQYGIYQVLDNIVSTYRGAVYKVFGFLDDPLRRIAAVVADLFRLRVEVQPYWKDMFIPIWLYFSTLAFAAKDEGRRAYRIALYVCGTAFALFFSVALAALGTQLRLLPALVTFATGVLLYELLAGYALLRLLVRREYRLLAPGLVRFLLEKTLTTLAIGLIVRFTFRFANDETAAALALIIFVLLLGLRDMSLAIFHAYENRGGIKKSFKERLFKSKSWMLGVIVVAIIIVATLGVAWGG